jgi:hypothetical protein
MRSFNLKIHEGKLAFSSDYHKALFNQFLKDNEEKEVEVRLKKASVSDKMRGYYFAAVIPQVRGTCEEWKDLSGDELHEVLKKMFNYFDFYNPLSERTERVGKPTLSANDFTNTASAMEFLMKIADYLADCGLEMPDPEEWKHYQEQAILK